MSKFINSRPLISILARLLLATTFLFLAGCGFLGSPAGMIDTTFGPLDGIAIPVTIASFFGGNEIADLHVNTDNSILTTGLGNSDFSVTRYNPDGSMTHTFGFAGVATLDLGGTDDSYALAIQSNDKIVLAGQSDNIFALARFNAYGAPDPSFGSGGMVTTAIDLDAGAYALALDNSERPLAAGYANNGGGDWFALARYDSDGLLDPTFGGSGVVTTSITVSSSGHAHAVLVQPDDKIIAVGHNSHNGNPETFALLRYNDDGSLDTSFDGDGVVTTTIGSDDALAYAAVLQPDGKIIAAGEWFDPLNGFYSFALARYNDDGSLDTSFGVGGIVTTTVGDDESWINAIVLQSDSKILVSGLGYDNSAGGIYTFALARYNDDGSLDSGFGVNGVVTTPINNDAESLSVGLRSDGRILAGGYSDGLPALVRYESDGSLDGSLGGGFGSEGFVNTVINGGDSTAQAVVLQPDEKIVAAGYVFDPTTDLDFALARYAENGELDPTFGAGGVVSTNFGYDSMLNPAQDEIYSIALDNNQNIVAAGGSVMNSNDAFALARYDSDGLLDPLFGGSGMVTTTVGGVGHAHVVLVQPDDKLVAVGHSAQPVLEGFALARYNDNGSLDSSFGLNGIVTTTIGSSDALAYAAVLQPDGKIVAAGEWYDPLNSIYTFALARYNDDGSLDSGFGVNGILTDTIGGYESSAYAVVLRPDGKIVVAGGWYDGANYGFALARYESDGTLDTSFGVNGHVNHSLGGDAFLYDLEVQADGKLVAMGDGGGVIIGARYNADGSEDTLFGMTGIMVSPIWTGSSSAYAAAIRPDDSKLVVVGETLNDYSGLYEFTIARFHLSEYIPETVSDSASSTFLPGLTITNTSGATCTFHVTHHPLPPGGLPIEAGEMPSQWRITTWPNAEDDLDCAGSLLVDLTFHYNDGDLLYSGGVDENNLTVYRFDGSAWVDMCATLTCVLDTLNKTITIQGVDAFSSWAIGDETTPGNTAPTAVGLGRFSGSSAAHSAWPLVGLALAALALAAAWQTKRR